jgi:hypothetical protein
VDDQIQKRVPLSPMMTQAKTRSLFEAVKGKYSNRNTKFEDRTHISKEKGQIFKEQWTKDFYFTCYNGKPICHICKESLLVLEEYNFECHYETNTKVSMTVLLVSQELIQ